MFVMLIEKHSRWSIQTDLGAILLVHLGHTISVQYSNIACIRLFGISVLTHIFRILVGNDTTHIGSGDIPSYSNQPITHLHNGFGPAIVFLSVTVI